MSETRTIDARGLLCPWPALRLARAAKEMAGKGDVTIVADDPIAPRELELMCGERGWQFAPDGEPHAFRINFG